MGYEPDRPTYQGLLGGDSWAIEVTGAELRDFLALSDRILGVVAALTEELVDEESFSCELHTERLTLGVSGLPASYRWHLQVHQGRRGEGFWDYGAVQEMGAALPEVRSHFFGTGI